MPNTSAARGLASHQPESMLDGPHARRLFHLAKRQHARIEIPSGEVLLLPYEKTTTLLDLFGETCKYCSISEQDYFGFAIRDVAADWYQFIDLSKKVSKFERKKLELKLGSSGKQQQDGANAPLFYFRLAYYVPCHVLPRDRGTKRQYYLQLRRNLREYGLLQTSEQLVSLVLYALQADFGPFGPHLLAPTRSNTMLLDFATGYMPQSERDNALAGEKYFDPARYFPNWMLEKFGEAYFMAHVPPLHASLKNMSRSEAEFHFIRECSSVTASFYNMHLYRLNRLNAASFGWLSAASSLLNLSLRGSAKLKARRSSSAKRPDVSIASNSNNSVVGVFSDGDVDTTTQSDVCASTPAVDNSTGPTCMWVGISPRGLELFERTTVDSTVYRSHVSSIAWHEIGKLRFKKTRLEIRVLTERGSRKASIATGPDVESPRRPASASYRVEDLQLADVTVQGSPGASVSSNQGPAGSNPNPGAVPRPRRSLFDNGASTGLADAAGPGSTASPSARTERVLVFNTASTAQSAQILELTKLQHVFQLKASLRAPQTADAVEMAERARYRESLISTASIRERANRARAEANANANASVNRRPPATVATERPTQRICVSVALDSTDLPMSITPMVLALPPPPPPPPQAETRSKPRSRSGRSRASPSSRESARQSTVTQIEAAAAAGASASNSNSTPVSVDVTAIGRARSQSPVSVNTVTTASSNTTPNTVIEQRSNASVSLTASPAQNGQLLAVAGTPTLAEIDPSAQNLTARRTESEDESGLGTLEPERGSDSPTNEADRTKVEHMRRLVLANRSMKGSAPLLASLDSAQLSMRIGSSSGAAASESKSKSDGNAMKSWKSMNGQLNVVMLDSLAQS